MNRVPLPSPEERVNLPPDGGPEFNRLIHETSPYLLQHSRNPVDWYPWGEAAFARARAENKPIFLSIGYSACHWCHVMEHESFENPEIAKILNTHFVSIKVDREERPDIDEFYMLATQLITGHGGWPNSVWLLPDGRPWYAGTYFPPEDRYGRIGFKTLLLRLAHLWLTRRLDIEEQANRIVDTIRQIGESPGHELTQPADWRALFQRAVSAWREQYDPAHGGFGDAPKFPPHTTLALLLERERFQRDPERLALATGTLDAMALGGIRDHIGGGFHRYSTDERWLLPHFEKMLYDNAQMAWAYTEAAKLAGDPLRRFEYEQAARETLEWILREMTSPDGAFYSSLDADSEGEEGKYYVWAYDEVVRLLGEEALHFCRFYNIQPGGNFHEEATGRPTGLNIPHLSEFLPDGERPKMAHCRAILLENRQERVPPGLDDKILTAWNGLAIAAFSRAARAFGETRYLKAAETAARSLLEESVVNGELMRVRRGHRAHIPGFLEDYASLANGLLELHEASRDAGWLDAAVRLARDMLDRFVDPVSGWPWSTGDRHDALPAKWPDITDQAMPAPAALAIRVWLRLAEANRGAEFRRAAERALAGIAPRVAQAPHYCAALLATGLALDRDPTPTTVTWTIRPLANSVKPGGVIAFAVEPSLASGWSLRDFPDGLPFRAAVEGPFTLVGCDSKTIRLRVLPDVADGEIEGKLSIAFQPCDSTACLPERTLEQTIRVRIQAE